MKLSPSLSCHSKPDASTPRERYVMMFLDRAVGHTRGKDAGIFCQGLKHPSIMLSLPANRADNDNRNNSLCLSLVLRQQALCWGFLRDI